MAIQQTPSPTSARSSPTASGRSSPPGAPLRPISGPGSGSSANSSTPSAPPSPSGPKALRGHPWSHQPIEQFLAGVSPPELTEAISKNERDRRGIGASTFAILQAALDTHEIKADLKTLLEPPSEGESKIDVLLTAVEAVLDTQRQILAGQAEIKSMLAALGSKPRA